jgi:competence protein ComEC
LLSAQAPSPWWLGAAGLLACCAWLSPGRHRTAIFAGAMLLAGQCLAGLGSRHWLEHRVPDSSAELRLLVEGVVDDVPDNRPGTLAFDLRVQRRLLRVSWQDAPVSPRVGERWRLLLRLSPLEERRNFTGPDLARQAFRRGVHGNATVLSSNLNELVELAPASLHTLRARIGLRVRESIADPDAAALVTALAVGLTSGMSRDQWRVFNATGTTHLVAISGLHVTLFAWLVFRCARVAWSWLPVSRFTEREPFALLSGLAAAGGYALLAGWSVPTQRTWLMLALYVCARLCARRVGAGRLWALAMVLVLLTDARAPLAAGFWLSFIAVGVLLGFAGEPAHAARPGARAWWFLRVQLLVTGALAPAVFGVSGGVSLIGIAVNLVAIPVISLLFVPVVLAGTLAAWLAPAWDAWFFSLAAWLYEWLWPGLAWCADVESGQWRATPSAWWFALALPAALLALCRAHGPLRVTSLCVLLPLLWPVTRSPDAGDAWVSVLDAGRGSAVLVRTRHHLLLFDTGDTWSTRGARMAGVVWPALDDLPPRPVDLLVLPVLDQDRAAGAALLALERGARRLLAGGGWPGSGLPVSRCRDARWQWDGVEFQAYGAGRYCALRVVAKGASMLLAGELDAGAEDELRIRWRATLRSDVVTMSRQAGERGSTARWIETVSPGLAIATGGIARAQSRQRVIERWHRHGSGVLDTRVVGGVELALGEGGVRLRAGARQSRFPFHWRRDPAPIDADWQRPPV